MPCYVSEDEKRGYSLPNPCKDKADKFLEEGPSNEWLIGALCAVLTEVQVRINDCGTFNSLIHDMERNGSIDYIGLWFYHHTQDDVKRLKALASNYNFSKHEKQRMKDYDIIKE